MATRRSSRLRLPLLVAAALAVASIRSSAHDLPNDVVVHAYVRPAGQHLEVIVRAPIAAMRDIVFPTLADNTLDVANAGAALRHAATLWLGDSLAIYEDGRRLPPARLIAARVSLPSDRSFASFAGARGHVTAAPSPDLRIVPAQALMDVLFEYDVASDRSAFSIEPTLARLGVKVVTVLRFVPPASPERAFELAGDPGLVRLDPRWHQAAARFVALGFFHILDGIDHLLFLLCLVIPFRRLAPLLIVVTAFTLAHSVTLVASALDLAPDALWFPPLIETLIAASIVYMALENIAGSPSLRRSRWAIALLFGLVHGFGFSFALRETLQFAGSHVVTSLLAFNVGVELGQVLVLLLFVPALQLLFRYVVAERAGTIILSAIVAHTAWHWMTERWATLSRFDWPAVTAAGAASALGWTLAALIVAAVVWAGSLMIRTFAPRAAAGSPTTARSAKVEATSSRS
jgi:hypothetical protein